MIKIDKKPILDKEWLELMKEAKSIGLTMEEIKLFLKDGGYPVYPPSH